MIQRIQSIYFSLVIVCLGMTTTGMEFFRFVQGDEYYLFSVYGIQKGQGTALSMYNNIPIYLSVIALCLFTFVTLMSYKNIKRQLKWARTLFYLYVFCVIGFLIFSTVGKGMFFESEASQELGMGYLFFVAGLPFSFLALIGVKKDKSANKAIGVNEIREYLKKQKNLNETIEKIAIKTRQYAKRQSTWARGNMINWIRLKPQDINKFLKKI